MEVCIFGVGAVGGYLAARLIASGYARVNLIARGRQLDAIRAAGLTLIENDERVVVLPTVASANPADLPPQDVVIVTVKAQAQPQVAAAVAGMLKPGGLAMFVSNGLPWWFGQGIDVPLPNFAPGISSLSKLLGQKSLGCVVYSNNEVLQPGVVQHFTKNHWLLGEYDGSFSSRLRDTCAMLRSAGLNAEPCADLRLNVWSKLVRNIADGPLCALTRLEPAQLEAQDQLKRLQARLTQEVVATAAAWGWSVGLSHADPSQSSSGAQRASGRPSMLQDVLLGRQVEVEPVVDRVRILATARGVPTPALDTVSSLLHGLNTAMESTYSIRPGEEDPSAQSSVLWERVRPGSST